MPDIHCTSNGLINTHIRLKAGVYGGIDDGCSITAMTDDGVDTPFLWSLSLLEMSARWRLHRASRVSSGMRCSLINGEIVDESFVMNMNDIRVYD